MNLKEYFNNKSIGISEASKVINLVSKHEINFYAYRMPDDNCVFGASFRLENENIFEKEGFLIAPFQTNEILQPALIPNDYNATNLPDKLPLKLAIDLGKIQESTSKEYYLSSVNQLVSDLKSKDNNKVVISKIIVNEDHINIGNLFEKLSISYPSAFVFCFYTADSGLWIGASPEQLLQSDNGKIQTMSLAGTRKKGSKNNWDIKNIREQNIVTEYIKSVFLKYKFKVNLSEPFTRIAGPVEHICSIISADAILTDTTNTLDFINSLSPTPALCGYPKEYALEQIRKIEKHNREYYGGYIGPVFNHSTFSLFVNLRSLFVNDCYYVIYAGGGITSESVAESEWDETEIKASTLLRIIGNCSEED